MQKPHLFIGLDMVDGCKLSPRKVDLAFLSRSLVCTFDVWDFNPQGDGLTPGQWRPPGFVLAIDGPQGLAASPGEGMRKCERQGRTPGKSPYDFPLPDKPFAGYITSSIRLFAALWQSGKFHLHGFPREPSYQATLIEVYPGKAWTELANLARVPVTEKKRRIRGREERQRLLEATGVRLSSSGLATHDQLDAALAAFIGFLYSENKCREEGAPPFWDSSKGVLREGVIVYPWQL